MVFHQGRGIHWVGAHAPAAGLSINAYLIDDAYPTLINAGAPVILDTMLDKISSVIDLSDLAYVVVPHAGIDYAGGLASLLDMVPYARVVTGSFEASRLALYGLYIQPLIIEDGDALSIGDHVLDFYAAPFVGSPGALFVFERTKGVLFSGDAFSSTVARWNLFANTDRTELVEAYHDTRIGDSTLARYAISKLAKLDVRMIAPGHGPVLRSHVKKYISALSGGYAEAV